MGWEITTKPEEYGRLFNNNDKNGLASLAVRPTSGQ